MVILVTKVFRHLSHQVIVSSAPQFVPARGIAPPPFGHPRGCSTKFYFLNSKANESPSRSRSKVMAKQRNRVRPDPQSNKILISFRTRYAPYLLLIDPSHFDGIGLVGRGLPNDFGSSDGSRIPVHPRHFRSWHAHRRHPRPSMEP